VDWETCQADFEWDGSLRDIYVLQTSIVDWDRLLDFLRNSGLPLIYEVDGASPPLPTGVASIFATRQDASPILKVDLRGMWLHSHFFTEDEIEFDLDPREVQDEIALARLLDFMRGVATHLGKTAILTPENWVQSPIFEVRPAEPPIYYPRPG
jgi:hypothetical protein